MQLWNDYEGRTIAEVYPLNKLIRPEGRSAFFLTTNGTGTPSMVRVIEAHFDESEILNRWRQVSEQCVEIEMFAGELLLENRSSARLQYRLRRRNGDPSTVRDARMQTWRSSA